MQIHCQSIQHEAKIMKDDAARQTAQALGVKARRLKGKNVDDDAALSTLLMGRVPKATGRQAVRAVPGQLERPDVA